MKQPINWHHIRQQLTHDQRIPLIVAGIFLLLALLTIIGLWQSLYNSMKPLPHSTTITTRRPIAVLPSISRWHLFGIYTISSNLPTTQLAIILEGTVVNLEEPNLSYAIISAPNNPAKLYRINNNIPGGATIERIYVDRIVIDNNGTLENLLLPRPKLLSSSLSTGNNPE